MLLAKGGRMHRNDRADVIGMPGRICQNAQMTEKDVFHCRKYTSLT